MSERSSDWYTKGEPEAPKRTWNREKAQSALGAVIGCSAVAYLVITALQTGDDPTPSMAPEQVYVLNGEAVLCDVVNDAGSPLYDCDFTLYHTKLPAPSDLPVIKPGTFKPVEVAFTVDGVSGQKICLDYNHNGYQDRTCEDVGYYLNIESEQR